MKIDSFGRLALAGAVSAFLLAGCGKRDEATVGTPANPLVVVLSPAHAARATADALAFVKKHLEAATALSVTLKTAKTPGETVMQFDTDRTDAGLVTLEEYLVAREEYGVRAALQALRGDKLAQYEGVLLARSASGPKAVGELSGRKTGFVGPYSVSGFTLPVIFLGKAGVKVQADFSASHEEVLEKLVKGEVSAAATYARQATRRPGIKILAYTGKIPNEPLIVRRGLDPEKRTLLVSAFLSLGDTKEGRRALGTIADITGFRPADEALYKPLHETLMNEGKTVYDLVPEGWDIYRLNEPYVPDR